MQNTSLFDTHAHYDHILFHDTGPETVDRLYNSGVLSGVVIPAISYESNFHHDMFPVDKFPYVFFAAGIHPKYAMNMPFWSDGGDGKAKQDQFLRLLDDKRTVAIKSGLDHAKKKLQNIQLQRQRDFFRYMIRLANAHQLPMVLHIRDAVEDALEILHENPLEVEAVVHCYTYGPDELSRFVEAGVNYFGIGGMLTRDEMGELREAVKILPLDRILLETDSPLVKPKGFHGELNTSEKLIETAELIAELKDVPVERVIEAVEKNAREFYGGYRYRKKQWCGV